MSELIKSYDNAAGRTAQVRYDTAHYPRPFWVEASGSMKLCATYRTQVEAEHAAAHFMATGDLPAAAEGSGVASPTPRSFGGESPRRSSTSSPGTAKTGKPETAQKPREGVDASQGAVSTHPAPETHFATPLQRQSAPAAQSPATRVSANS